MVIISNLYPLPWEPNRAKFNQQQFELLKQHYDLSVLVPVAFPDWFKHRKQITQSQTLRYVPYFYTPKTGRRFYSAMMFMSIMLHSGWWLQRKKADILMASWAFPEAVATSWFAKLFSARFFFKVHGSDINHLSLYPARIKQIQKAAKRAKGILSVSKALAKEMSVIGIAEDKISVIYNGVDHSTFGVPVKRLLEPDYLLYIGNLKPDKGVIELVEGFIGISALYSDLHLVIVGSGAMKQSIESRLAESGLTDRVHLLGSVEHSLLAGWISYARLLALPSYAEGVPNVVLESMACGTPVLATRVGGIPEVVDESTCGVLIEPKDVRAVELGLQKVLTTNWDPKAIKQHASQFSWLRNQELFLSMLRKKD